MPIYRFVAQSKFSDPRADIYLSDARALGFNELQRITCQDLYFIEGQLSQEICQQLALKLLTDPVTQSMKWTELPAGHSASTALSAGLEPDSVMVEVALRPGVTDPVAEQIVRASHELGIDGVSRAATGMRFLIEGADRATAEKLAKRLLANNVIQHWTVGEITPSFPEETASSGVVEVIPVRGSRDDELLA